MIGCDNPTCTVKWFHMECVGLSSAPDGDWICTICKGARKHLLSTILVIFSNLILLTTITINVQDCSLLLLKWSDVIHAALHVEGLKLLFLDATSGKWLHCLHKH